MDAQSERPGRAARGVASGIPEHFEAPAESACLVAEGASYADALPSRIAAGISGAGDFAGVVAFLQSGPMLHGFACVIVGALRRPPGPMAGPTQ